MKKLIFLLAIVLLPGCSKKIIRYHGSTYTVVNAGDLSWMGENLASDRYRSGKKIPLVQDYKAWTELLSPGCCYYSNDPAMLKKYGMLYNWYAVEEGRLCPSGWRVASNNDWVKLENFLGGHMRAGGKLSSKTGWKGRHISGDDIGFKALPGGYRLNEDFSEGWAALWWTSSPVDTSWVWGRRLNSGSTELHATLNDRQNGFSVRCVRDK